MQIELKSNSTKKSNEEQMSDILRILEQIDKETQLQAGLKYIPGT